jgi:hypothetical protein
MNMEKIWLHPAQPGGDLGKGSQISPGSNLSSQGRKHRHFHSKFASRIAKSLFLSGSQYHLMALSEMP